MYVYVSWISFLERFSHHEMLDQRQNRRHDIYSPSLHTICATSSPVCVFSKPLIQKIKQKFYDLLLSHSYMYIHTYFIQNDYS